VPHASKNYRIPPKIGLTQFELRDLEIWIIVCKDAILTKLKASKSTGPVPMDRHLKEILREN
jgi:hypothetical protein